MTRPHTLLWAFSTFALGGPQRRFLTLAESLGGRYRHVVFAMDGRYDAAAAAPDSVEIVKRPIRKGGLVSRANLTTLRGLVGEVRPELLLTSNWGCIEWFLANRGRIHVPHIHFEDGFGPDERPDAQNPKRLWARRILFRRRSVRFVAPSHVLAEVFATQWRVAPERVHLIPNGVDCARFAPVARAERPGLTIGTVAALRPEKRIDRLVEAFRLAAIPQARLLIVGDGPERTALEAKAAGLPVEFMGARDDVVPFLERMDVFAMSSDTEQMPIGLVEAMASGLPVAATDVGDIARMVAPDNAPFVVAPEAPPLAEALRQLATDGVLRARLGAANARKAGQDYALDGMVTRYEGLFREAMARR